MDPLRIIFAGTPDFAAIHLKALLDSHHQVVAVYTQPDRPAGRGKKLSPSPVKQYALEADIEVRQPLTLKDTEVQRALAALEPDLMVVVAYGLLLPQKVLDIPRLGCVNVHASLLPRWRGAAPIQRAIEAGDEESGITLMQMEAGLDTGPMLLRDSCRILPEDTGASLHDRLASMGPRVLCEGLDLLAAGTAVATVQDDQLATYAKKLDKAEGALDWQQAAGVLERKIRAFNPFPGCYSFAGDTRIKILGAHCVNAIDKAPGQVSVDTDRIMVACGEGALSITHLQWPGKGVIDNVAFLNGIGRQWRDTPPRLFSVGK